MASELSSYQRFNTSIVPEAGFTPVWQPRRASSLGADFRIKRQSRPFWEGDLSGALMNNSQRDNVLGIIYRNGGMTKPVLVPVPPFCEIGITADDADENDEAIVTPAPLCVGDGGEMNVQLRKRLLVEGYETEFIYETIKFPHWDYPQQYSIGRTINGPNPWNPLREIMVYRAGVPMAPGSFTVGKETGIVTIFDTDLGVNYTVTGGFYLLMLLPNKIPMFQKGGLWEVKNGIALSEPNGGY